jgi:hypothetical protein
LTLFHRGVRAVVGHKKGVFGNYRGVPPYIVVIESRSSQGAPP